MKLFRDENGQTLIFTAFLMCCLMGFMAVAIDVGVLFRAQRKVQTAADAAAVAGTLEYYYHGSGNAASVAKNAATVAGSGVTDQNQVTVNIPPASGWHTGSAYLEVVIRQPNTTLFMGAFAGLFPGGGTSFSPMTVAARAVGGIIPGASCVYLLNQSDPGALTVKGNASVTSPNCTWTVDSSSPQAFCITGQNSNAQFNSPGVILGGGQSTSGNCNKLYGGATTGGSTSGDPLGNLISFPNPATVCNASNTFTGATVNSGNVGTLPSNQTSTVGGYSTATTSYNIVCFDAGAGIPTTLSSVTLGSNSASGKNNLYLFRNGLVLSGTNTVYGSVDLANGAFCQGSYNSSNGKCSFTSAGGGPSISIYASASVLGGTQYAFNGMAFMVPPTNFTPQCDNAYGGVTYTNTAAANPNSCIQIQFGSGSGQLDGMIYAPRSALFLQDSGGTGIGVTNLIVNSTFINGELNITANYNYAHSDSPLTKVSLVE